jgi:hypothetical protein
MSGKRKRNAGTRAGKREYRPPKLVVHGDLRSLTLVKGGSRGDGRGKPRTRASGGNR